MDDVSLLEHLDSPQVNCLNEAADHNLKSILEGKQRNTSDAFLLSGVDEQLLLNLPFNQNVRIRSLILQTSNPQQAPLRIKLFINRDSLGFEDVEDAGEPDAAQVMNLTEEQTKEGKKILLRFVRFQSVSSLHIFVASNAGGDDETRIDALDVLGSVVGGTRDLAGLRKEPE